MNIMRRIRLCVFVRTVLLAGFLGVLASSTFSSAQSATPSGGPLGTPQAGCPTKADCEAICGRAEEAERAAAAAKAEADRLAGLVALYEKLVEQTRQQMESQLKTAAGYDQLGDKKEAARLREEADKSAQKVLELQQTLAELRDKLAEARADAEAKAKVATALRAECDACWQKLAKPPCAGSEVTGAGQNAVGDTAGAVKPDKVRETSIITRDDGTKTIIEWTGEHGGQYKTYAVYDSQGKLRFRSEFTYGPGVRTEITYDAQGNIKSREEYTYLPDGQQEGHVTYDGQGKVKSTETRQYLPDGNYILTTDDYILDSHFKERVYVPPPLESEPTKRISVEVFRGGKLVYSDGLEEAAKLLGEIIDPTKKGEENRGFNPIGPEKGQPKAGEDPSAVDPQDQDEFTDDDELTEEIGHLEHPQGILSVKGDAGANDPRWVPAARSPQADGSFQLAALRTSDTLASLADGNIFFQQAASPAPADTGAGASKIEVSVVSNGKTGAEAFQVQVFDPAGKVKRIRMPSGVVIEPLKRGNSKPVAERHAGAQVLTKQVAALCLDFAKLPPALGTLYRIAPQAVQEKFKPLRSVLQAGHMLAEKNQLHPDSEPKAYGTFIRQFALWTKIERWDEKKFTDVFLDRSKQNAGVMNVKWSKEMEDTLRAAAPGRWRDVTAVLTEAEAISKASITKPAD